MKTILYITTMSSPFQVEFVERCNRLSRHFRFLPVYLRRLPSYRNTWGEKCFTFPVAGNNVLSRSWTLLCTFLRYRPSTIIISQYNTMYVVLTVLYSFVTRTRYAIGPLEIQGRNKTIAGDIIKRFVFRMITRRASAVLAIGRAAATHYQQLYAGAVLDCPYSFDLATLLQNRNHPESTVTFLYSGRLVDFRNPLFAIRAFHRVHEQSPNVRLLISGQGPLRPQCDELIESLNIGQWVRWENDFTDWYDIHKRLYPMANVLLALQKSAGWGLIIQEAIAAGLGIVATRRMAAADSLVIDGYNGFLVNLMEAQVIERMLRYARNPGLIQAHGRRSQEMAPLFDVQASAGRLVEFIESPASLPEKQHRKAK